VRYVKSSDGDCSWKQFKQSVNMTAGLLETWLKTGQSHGVGQARDFAIQAGRPQLSDDDYAHMRKVVGNAKRHPAQRPRGDVSDGAWRYSLLNWGHDPTRT